MGIDGKYYDRDVVDGYARTADGNSATANKEMSRGGADPGLFPMDRFWLCEASSPVVLSFDVTASPDMLSKIFYDKMPLVAGQTVERRYLNDAMICVAANGDIVCDKAPIQIGDFSKMRSIDDWLKRIWLERGGGGQHVESYEYMAYAFARRCSIPNAVTPFFIFIGDEGFRETLYASDLKRHFGGEHATVEAQQIFTELKQKFHGNVFLIHKRYVHGNGDEGSKIIHQWQRVLGKEHIAILGSDQSIADVILGIFALLGGSRTLEEYLDDLKTARHVPQTDARVREVRASLVGIEALRLARLSQQKADEPSPPSMKWL